MFTEQLRPGPDMWEQVVAETLASQEIEGQTFDVYPLIGRISSGKNTIQGILKEWLSEKDGIQVDLSSAGGAMRQHQIEQTGRRMKGHFNRAAEVDMELDLSTARQILNPSNKGKILIPEGRLLGFISLKVKDAAERLHLTLPCNIQPILLTADNDIRYAREYEKLHDDNPSISPEQAKILTLDRERGEDITFRALYSDLNFQDWYNPNYTDRHEEKVYKKHIDTSVHSAGFCARQIYDFIQQTSIVQAGKNH